jgi:ParB family chromosome partitioning protein
MTQNRGLGRGLGALIPGLGEKTGDDAADQNKIVDIPLSRIIPNKNQPRNYFNEETLNELAESIRAFGVIQPIIVRDADRDGKYEIISGERRYKAAKKLDFENVPCIINRNIDDISSLEMALIENIQREDLTPIELSHTFKQLIDDFKLTHEELSNRICKSRVSITNSLRLLLLPLEIQKMVDEQKISAGHARALLGLEKESDRISLANSIVKNDLNVREVEKIISKKNSALNKPAVSNEKELKLLQFEKLPGVERAVSDYLEAPVCIKVGRIKGKIEITFGSVKDFERIVHKIIDRDA